MKQLILFLMLSTALNVSAHNGEVHDYDAPVYPEGPNGEPLHPNYVDMLIYEFKAVTLIRDKDGKLTEVQCDTKKSPIEVCDKVMLYFAPQLNRK